MITEIQVLSLPAIWLKILSRLLVSRKWKNQAYHHFPTSFYVEQHQASDEALLGKGLKDMYSDDEKHKAERFWRAVFGVMPEWQMVRRREISPASMRQEFIHSHGVGLQAIGLMGKGLLQHAPYNWEQKLEGLRDIDWRKANPEWLKRTMLHGKISKSAISIHLTCNALKQKLGIPLNSEEQKLEEQLKS